MGTTENATEGATHERVLQDSEERYRTVVSAAGNTIICLDPKHRIIEWNNAAEELYGFRRSEVLGKDYLAMFIPVEHQENIAADIIEVLDGKATRGYVNPIRRRDGIERTVSWTVTRMRDSQGMPIGVIAVGTDVTDQNHAQDQIRKAKQFSERLINCSVDGIIAFDSDCRYTVWNSGMERISGVRKDECLHKCAFDVFPFLKENGEDQFFFDALDGKEVVAKDRPFVVPETGRQGFFEGHYSPIYDAAGEIQGGLAIIRDITDRKHKEQQIQHQQEELIHASRLSMMGELASGLAHELNQPLFAISNYSQACQRLLSNKTVETAEVMELLENSSAEAQRAGKIINRLREFVRKRQPCRSSLNVNSLIVDACHLIEFERRRQSVSISFELADDLPLGFCDPIQIQQVLLNLVRNGIEAMLDNMSQSRELTIKSSWSRGRPIEIAIRDSGRGLGTDRPDRVFEMFYSTKDEGMGLGLAISRSIVEAHGGRIWATAPSSQGAEFRFTLPVHQR